MPSSSTTTTGVVVIFAVILEGVNAFQGDISRWLSVTRHMILTVSFIVAGFAITAIGVRKLARAAGRQELARKAGIGAGVRASLVFPLLDLTLASGPGDDTLGKDLLPLVAGAPQPRDRLMVSPDAASWTVFEAYLPSANGAIRQEIASYETLCKTVVI